MSTFADKNIRIFRTRSKEEVARLKRKRSDGRLKSFCSATDNRAWHDIEEERKRHILELFKTYETQFGNYIPFEDLLDILFQIAEKEKTTMIEDALDNLQQVDGIINENEKLGKKLKEAEKKKKELEVQKKELNSLATCLSRAGGDLRKENACLKAEIDRLKKRLAELENKAKKCEEERAALRKELDEYRGKGKPKKKNGQGDNDCEAIKAERDHLRNELDKLRCVQQDLKCAEQRVTELLCEIESLQKCLKKAEVDAMKMVQIIEQQQTKITSLQMCECKLQDISNQREFLKKQLDNLSPCPSQNNDLGVWGSSNLNGGQGNLRALECQKKQLEQERNNLRCQLQITEEELKCKEKDIGRLNKKLCNQNECINSLKEMLAISDPCPKPCEKSSSCNSVSSSDYGQDLEDMQCKMSELRNKVGKQAQIIISQRNCILEQHKYILEQEAVRGKIQDKIRDQTRKQAELIYERNLLRNEIVFLTTRLKTYLGKIQMLEKSIEQLFDTTKSSNCGDESGFLDDCNGGDVFLGGGIGSSRFGGGRIDNSSKLKNSLCGSDCENDINSSAAFQNPRGGFLNQSGGSRSTDGSILNNSNGGFNRSNDFPRCCPPNASLDNLVNSPNFSSMLKNAGAMNSGGSNDDQIDSTLTFDKNDCYNAGNDMFGSDQLSSIRNRNRLLRNSRNTSRGEGMFKGSGSNKDTGGGPLDDSCCH